MRKKNKFKKPEITSIYRVVRFDIGKETADTYLENALEKVLRDMDDDSIPYRFGFPVSVEELKICYNEKVGAYIVQFLCGTGSENSLPEYARFTLQCDEERYAMLSDDDWKSIFTLIINEKNPDPKIFSKNVVTKLRQRTHDLRLTPLKSGFAAQENRGYNDGTSSSPVRVRAVD